MALRFVSGLVVDEGLNVLSGKVIFGGHRILFSDVNPFLRDLLLFGIREVLLGNAQVFSEAHDIDTFSVLRYSKIHCIHNLRVGYDIANLIKGFENGLKRSPFIMNHQALDVFKEEGFWLIPSQNFGDIKKQCTSRFLETQTLACKRESLTGKSRTKNIKALWYLVLHRFLRNIAKRNVPIVGIIRFASLFVPFGREYTLST